MTVGTGSVYVRKALGRRLKELRVAARKTHADVGDVGSVAKIKRIEAGDPPIKMPDVRAVGFLYGADAATTEQLAEMSLIKEENWWEEYSEAVPQWLGKYLALETAAGSITTFDPELIHGLLQTPAYHRAIFDADADFVSADVDLEIGFRAERQRAAFGRTPPLRVTAVLGEGALVRAVGGTATVQEQRVHLLEMSEQDHVDVFVLPWAAGAHTSMKGAFTILSTDNPEEPDVVYLETLGGGRYMERQDLVERYRRNAEIIMSQSVTIKEYLS
jgi:hypothetical protein